MQIKRVMENSNTVTELVSKEYKYGFITDIETEKIPKGIDENVAKKI